MDNCLTIFNYRETQVRTIQIDGEPWFVLKDVCTVLSIKNQADVFNRLDDDEKGVDLIDTLGGKQKMYIINEAGLYNVILRSDKPEAKPFRKWVTSEVLPAIRKTGGYIYGEEHMNDDELFARAVLLAQEKIKQREERIAQLQQQNLELQPKASYYDMVLQSKDLVSVTQIAKDFGMSAKALNKILNEKGIQFKQGNSWLLYQKYAEQGFTQSKTHMIDEDQSVMYTYWTQKGRLFLYDFLKRECNILPIVEKGEAV